MDMAFCTVDGKNYTVKEFESLQDGQLDHYRQNLLCIYCHGPGFYRKESKSGQAACFGARPHEKDCPVAAAETRRGSGLGDDQEERINPGERIELDLNYGAHEIVNAHEDGTVNPNGKGGRYTGQGERPKHTVMHRRLSTLLRMLMAGDGLKNSTQVICTSEGDFEARNFFKNFTEIKDEDQGKLHGFWGLISDAKIGTDSTWLNSGGRGDASIPVNQNELAEIAQRFGISELEDFAGSYVLIVGKYRKSIYGKKYIPLQNTSHITINL